ncbi:copper resistance CopC family protein [Aquibacillus salsiterrae]|uniref:Copper resistance protein CopC n=1 Tax=Aquibacillus salsiterrae TaxID=2950439 RepID=A0A9X3WG07_9BACI|nr:copper resistance protein CopC [Aquibacillus salsiterrae]MDC3416764.1 copper resistance protein CopC [Aquibacillus salsiterrae]
MVNGIKLVAITFILFTTFMSTVNAHSVLEEANPAEGETMEGPLSTIELSFNTKLENGSTIYLVNDESEEIEAASINLEDNVLTGVFDDLKSGNYTVMWRIIGTDGHLIENDYSFTINNADEDRSELEGDDQVMQSDASDSTDEIDNQDLSQGETEKETLPEQKTSAEEKDEDTVTSSIPITTIAIVILVGLLSSLLFILKKKK